jgi:hypothetical protein
MVPAWKLESGVGGSRHDERESDVGPGLSGRGARVAGGSDVATGVDGPGFSESELG